MIMASAALLSENPHPSEAEIREGISGNLCRCTGYNMIVDAINLAAKKVMAYDRENNSVSLRAFRRNFEPIE
ncbi:hypothetical protein KEH51_12405 [[Brevibacterium] frigoritolerans]|uniref:[2Fe-2S]-binding domain-containing protein n=1 Tax=Peribacillus frigoritolerans TaxID=450367 RepID=A0A941FK26_9BACI|nr:hypothetical protein [Peribacillus frigoritolerans]